MAISTRNQLNATVTAIQAGASNDVIELTLAGGEKLAAVITAESTHHLGLQVGSPVVALFKAPSVVLSTDDDLILSARNQLAATVVNINEGAVNTEVIVRTTGGVEIVAILTQESVKNLALAVNSSVKVIVKASHVLLGVKKAG